MTNPLPLPFPSPSPCLLPSPRDRRRPFYPRRAALSECGSDCKLHSTGERAPPYIHPVPDTSNIFLLFSEASLVVKPEEWLGDYRRVLWTAVQGKVFSIPV